VTAHLDGTEYPQQQCLEHDQDCIADTNGEIYSDVFADVVIAAIPAIGL
jgi:hypothetical protein